MERHYWTDLNIGDYFRIPGFDDLLQKVSDTHAKDHGCGLLFKPIRFARKGTKILMATPESDADGLIKM